MNPEATPSDSSGPAHPVHESVETPSTGKAVSSEDVERAREVLGSHRQSIDNIDAALVHLLAERFKFTQAVGALKAEHGLPAGDPDREARQVERLTRLAKESGLDPTFTKRFLHFIVTEVIRHHERIAEEN